MRLMVVEDEPRLVEVLRQGLTDAGFATDTFSTKADAAEAITNYPYDAVVLDLGLPDGDGLTLLTRFRDKGGTTPILILTARDAVENRVTGLNSGADDYLVKPFAITELVARIKALLRRPGGVLGTVLSSGNLQLDTVGRDVRIGSETIQCPRQETAILEQLLRRQGRVVPRSVLEDKLYGIDAEPDSNPIAVHIHRLRKRLEDAKGTAEIHTVRGVGYILVEKDG